MSLFVIVCGLVIAAALAAEARFPKGVLIVSPGIWYAIIAALWIWLLTLVCELTVHAKAPAQRTACRIAVKSPCWPASAGTSSRTQRFGAIWSTGKQASDTPGGLGPARSRSTVSG